MKGLTVFYIFLYVTHILFGPYYFWYIFTDTPFKLISKDVNEVLRRSIWITYVGFLCIALFNEYPNAETFLVAYIISLLSTIGYFIKFKDSAEYMKGTIDHLWIMILPLCILFFHYKIKINTYKPTYLSFIAFIYILIMRYIHTILY
jgi:hypothetical protein